MTPEEAEHFLQFIYFGEVSVPMEGLDRLIQVAKDLGIKGLHRSESKRSDGDEDAGCDDRPAAKLRKGDYGDRVSEDDPTSKKPVVKVEESIDEYDPLLEERLANYPTEEDAVEEDYDYFDDNDQCEEEDEGDDDGDYSPPKQISEAKRKRRENLKRKRRTKTHVQDISSFTWNKKNPKKSHDEAIYNGDDGDQVIEVLKTQNNMPKIAMNGFTYLSNNVGANNAYWRCSLRSCPGRIKTDSHYLAGEATQNHNHPPDYVAIEVMKWFTRLKEAALGTDKSATMIYEELLQGLGQDVIAALPPRAKVLSKICKQRQVERGRHEKKATSTTE